MNKTKNTIGICAISIFVIGALFLAFKGPTPSQTPIPVDSKTTVTTSGSTTGTTQNTTTGTGTGSSTGSGYTLADVAVHNSQASCWTAIGGNVYDLTSWIAQHPGGEEAILSICGIDGTSAFLGQHGDNRRANAELASFKIGTLK